nr:MAG TPA: hypothetical protein [Caudoviricetes sp.]
MKLKEKLFVLIRNFSRFYLGFSGEVKSLLIELVEAT